MPWHDTRSFLLGFTSIFQPVKFAGDLAIGACSVYSSTVLISQGLIRSFWNAWVQSFHHSKFIAVSEPIHDNNRSKTTTQLPDLKFKEPVGPLKPLMKSDQNKLNTRQFQPHTCHTSCLKARDLVTPRRLCVKDIEVSDLGVPKV